MPDQIRTCGPGADSCSPLRTLLAVNRTRTISFTRVVELRILYLHPCIDRSPGEHVGAELEELCIYGTIAGVALDNTAESSPRGQHPHGHRLQYGCGLHIACRFAGLGRWTSARKSRCLRRFDGLIRDSASCRFRYLFDQMFAGDFCPNAGPFVNKVTLL